MASTILIVEDHQNVRESLAEWILLSFPGCRCLGAASGEEAIQIADNTSPDIVLMDVALPGINGVETTRLIKTAFPSIYIIMLTIHDEYAYRTSAKEAGADAYIPKRIMQVALIPTIKRLLENKHQPTMNTGA